MRPLATLFLVLGAADLVALNLVIGPAALSAQDPGAEGSRGRRINGSAAIPQATAPEPPPTLLEQAVEPDLPSTPRPLATKAAAVATAPAPSPDPETDSEPDPDPEPEPDPAKPDPGSGSDKDPGSDRDPGEHDPLPGSVTLHFDLDQDDLGGRSRASLDRVADLLANQPALGVSIAGHADESGTSDHNQDLSERRAQAVAEYLQARGIAATRLAVRAFGETNPLGDRSERSRKNRRVEIHFASSAAIKETE